MTRPVDAARAPAPARCGDRLPLLLVLGLAACGGAPAPRPGPPPDLLLISIDTLRADRLGCYGNERGLTPHLDRLCEEGLMFESVTSPVPITLPAHCSMLTGLAPPRHGVRDNLGFALPASIPTVAERLQAGGYRTAAFIGGVPLARAGGLARGFDLYDDALPRRTFESGLDLGRGERYAEEVVAAASAWIDQVDPQVPLFAFIHLYDPHVPYEKALPGESEPSYDGEVAYVDRVLGSFLDRFPSRGRNLITVVTADHGEGLGEHGEATHALFVYQSTLRVPLLVHGVPGLRGRRSAPVGLVDVMPLLLQLAGLEIPDDIDGRGILEDPPADRPIYFESLFGELRFGWAPLHGTRQGSWKAIDAPRPELFDLARDPGELQDRIGAEPERASALLQEARTAARDAVAAGAPIDDERRRALESLGYLSAAPAGGTTGADPKDRIDEYRRFNDAHQAALAGRPAESLAIFAELESAFSGSPMFYERWADITARSGDPRNAVALYRKALRLNPGSVEARLNLGVVLYRTNAATEALAEFEEVLRRDPERVEAHLFLAQVLGGLGRTDERRAHLQEFLRLAPDHPQADAVRRALAGS